MRDGESEKGGKFFIYEGNRDACLIFNTERGVGETERERDEC